MELLVFWFHVVFLADLTLITWSRHSFYLSSHPCECVDGTHAQMKASHDFDLPRLKRGQCRTSSRCRVSSPRTLKLRLAH